MSVAIFRRLSSSMRESTTFPRSSFLKPPWPPGTGPPAASPIPKTKILTPFPAAVRAASSPRPSLSSPSVIRSMTLSVSAFGSKAERPVSTAAPRSVPAVGISSGLNAWRNMSRAA